MDSYLAISTLSDAELAAQINWRSTLEEFLEPVLNVRPNSRQARTNGAVVVDTSGSRATRIVTTH